MPLVLAAAVASILGGIVLITCANREATRIFQDLHEGGYRVPSNEIKSRFFELVERHSDLYPFSATRQRMWRYGFGGVTCFATGIVTLAVWLAIHR